MDAKGKIIVALDVSTIQEARALVTELKPHVGGFKIGLELLMTMLASIVVESDAAETAREIQELFRDLRDCILFIDGKFHDIPTTVAGATRAAVRMGATMLTVHAAAGTQAMQAAAAHKGSARLLAVTVLTSLGETDCECIYNSPLSNAVVILASIAQHSGCDGAVCSSHEIDLIHETPESKDLILVVPGIRAEDAPPDDQQRTMPAAQAMHAGATYLVIGRPITKAPDRVAAACAIATSIAKAL